MDPSPGVWIPEAISAVNRLFDGVKLAATVSLNGKLLGNTTNQHRRYTFDVTGQIKGENTLSVRFDRSMSNGGRFMACSGGWDW